MKAMHLWLWTVLVAAAPDAGPAVAQPARREPPFRGTSFLLARYASTRTMTLYSAYGVGPVMGFVGVVRNPRSASHAVVVGGGTRLRIAPRAGVTLLAALAGGSDGASVRLYALPAMRFGRWRLTGTATTQMPLEARGHWKATLDPITASRDVTRSLEAGVAAVARSESGKPASVGAGPAVALRIGGTTTRAELIRLSPSGRFEGRLGLAVAF